MADIEFGKGGVPVRIVAEVYGKDACWVRAGLITGYLPIGRATRNGTLLRLIGTEISQEKVLHPQMTLNLGSGARIFSSHISQKEIQSL